ncbi:amino acid adenylation domain-containing protein [Streptomyces sp. NPDC056202]|uniref:amino acid adenylation domain-containing protein n=1 Tax=Streptomyces sp. NPDC056202 TaxID=3345745 RepID=UPI0035E123B0
MRGYGETVLWDVLAGAAEAAPDEGIVLVDGDGGEKTVSHRALFADALRVAGGFLDAGLAPGSHVVLPAERSEEFLPLFWGAVAAGLVPVPLAPDVRRVRPVWEFLDEPPVAVGSSALPVLDALPGSVRSLTLGELREHPAPLTLPKRVPGDVAFLQFSSGSTGAPKGVELTHAAVLANLAQIRAAAGIRSADVLATWMPYFHDMGLIGTHLLPMSARIRQVRIEPLTFAKRPLRWLEAASRHRATLLSAANFALALVERRVPADALARLDLTCVRMMLVGAEPISPAVWRAFVGRMRPTGLPAYAPTPVYGLAESTLAVTFPPPGEVARPLALDRAALGRGRAVDAAPGPDAVELMDVGSPVHGCAVRITDDAGHPVEERRVGHIEVSGPQVARGYHGAVEATAETFRGAWLRTGDLGFLREGRLCVTGRSKDVVFVDGHTLHASDLEEVAANTPGLTLCPIAVVGSTGHADADGSGTSGSGGERVVVFLAPAPPLSSVTAELLHAVRDRVRAALGHDDVRVVALPVRGFPRTTSGKVRRGVLRERFERGEYPEIAGRASVGVSGIGALTTDVTAGVAAGMAADATPDETAESVADMAADVTAEMTADVTELVEVRQPSSDALPRQRSGDRSEELVHERSAVRGGDRTVDGVGSRREPGADASRTAEGPSSAVLPPAAAPLSRPDVETVVRGLWARALGLPGSAIGLDDDFRALGGSSLKAMEVLAGLEDAFGVVLRPSDVRDYTTVAALAGLILAGGSDDAGPGAGVGTSAGAGASAGASRPHGSVTGGRPSSYATPEGSDRTAPDEAADAAPHDSASADKPLIAVSGLACRLPGADTPEAFWDRLLDGYDAVIPVPEGRWGNPADGHARWGAFLDEPDGFDAGFFGIGDEEARATDPQARILLELAHEALERAGYAGPRRRGRRVGVFVAAGDSGYRRVLEQSGDEGELPAAALTGNLPNMLAARVAHCLDLTGPALAVDTACSSALVALHLARRSLQAGECDIAVVGGVHLNLTPAGYALLEKAGALSPTGRCHAFGASADGFVPGEGGAALVLTRLDEAQEAGDPVLAVLRGTAVNNDGRSLSLMAPNPLTQREVITQAYRDAGIGPDSVSYVEAHGTGTPLGDPVELRSLAHAFPALPDGRLRLLGSVKTNVGHLLNAAGMPSLVKVILALGQRRLPPSPLRSTAATATAAAAATAGARAAATTATTPSPSPDLAGSGFALVDAARDWEAPGPLVAGINAFGFGGTNAHAVLEEPPAPRRSESVPSHGPRLLTLSAHGQDGLRASAAGLAARLRDRPRLDEGDVCAAVAAARDEGPDRLSLVADGDLAARLEAVLDGVTPTSPPVRSRARLVLLLPGQGVRPQGQARALYADAPAFRATLDEASDHVGPIGGRSLAAWCLDEDTASPDALARTEIAQPLLVAYGIALARQVRAWGITPDAVAGHSVGEIAAACVAGTLSLADAVRFAAERGRLMAELCAPGAMAAVRCGEDTVADLVARAEGELSLAAVNGPDQVVLAGTETAVERAIAALSARGVVARRLGVSRAFHSPLMDPALDALTEAARTLVLRPLTERTTSLRSIPLISTVTADWQPVLEPDYLRAHARQPVRFGAAVERLLGDGYDTFVELGAGALGGSVRAVAGAHPRGGRAVALAAGHQGGARGLLETVGRLWERGVPLDRSGLDGGRARISDVPTYPFQRRRYWPAAAARPRPPVSLAQALDQSSEPSAVPAPAQPQARSTPLVHRVGWEDAPSAFGPRPRSVLLAGPDSPLSRAFADRLVSRGVTVRRAAGDTFVGDGAVPEGAPTPEVVVLLAGPAVEPDSADALDAAHRAMATGLQNLLPELALHRPRVLVVTEDVHVTGAGPERPRPAQAVLTGLTLALPAEFPGVVAHSVDLTSLDGTDARLDALDHELTARPLAPASSALASASASASASADDGAGLRPAHAVAWRAGRRLGRTTEAVTTEPGMGPDPDWAALPPHGTYLITGGAGGVGAALARDLAGRGRPTLLLTGRSAEPPTGLLAELRSLGATVDYRAADVSHASDVDTLLAGLPRLDVLIHAAGVVRPGTLRAKTPDELADGLAAKTRGTELLARGVARHDLHPALCVAFSSVASVLPGLAGAIGDYAAANAYLDAFAAAERAAGRAWLAVNFAAFADTGLASGTSSARGPVPLATGEALDALRTACSLDGAQIVVADLGRRAAPAPRTSAGFGVPPLPSAAPATASRTDQAATTRSGGVSDVLRRLLSEALHVSPEALGDDDPLLGLGLDSLMAVDLVKRLEQELDRTLPITLFFEHHTLGELARELGREPGEPEAGPDREPDRGPDCDPEAEPDLGPFSLTPVQLAFHTQGGLYPDVPAYGYVSQDIRGPLDPDLLGEALGLLADRHPMLRIRLLPGDSAPAQAVAPSASQETPRTHAPDWYEVRALPGVRPPEEEFAALEEALCNRPFDLTAEAPVRAVLVTAGASRAGDASGAGGQAAERFARLVLVVHHAAADGFSLNILGEELWTLYTALSLGRTPELPPLALDFASYIAHEESERSDSALAEDRSYWREVLGGRGEPLALPYDGDPLGQPEPPLLAHQMAPGPHLTAALRETAAAHGVSLFHLLLAAYARCLSRWSGGREDVTVNVARARREARLAGMDRLVGPLADTLPVPARVGPDDSVHALAVRLRDAWPESERHSRLTSLDLARLLPADGAGPRTTAPASFSFARFPVALDPDCPVEVRPASAGTASAATRLSLLCWESDGELAFSWNFPARLFDRSTVARLAAEHVAELHEAAGLVAPPVGTDRMNQTDRTGELNSLAVEFDDVAPDCAPPAGRDIVARLRAQFRATPDAVAVDTDGSLLTYAELDRASGTLAARLRDSGVVPGDLVGLLTEPGADAVIGVVGILRAGAGWVPLDAAHPPVRLADQLHRSRTGVLVCHAATKESAAALASSASITLVAADGPCLGPHAPSDGPHTPSPEVESPAPGPDSLAYVIFTSGSTGRPKAVPITRRSMTNYLDWALATFDYGAGDRLAQTASLCFDASVRQLLAPLLVGATVVTLPRQLLRDPEALLDRVEQSRISVWSSVPSLWSRLLEAAETRVRTGGPAPDLSALRWIHVGGEALPPAHVRRWYDLFGPGHRIANLYGPTESTINATFHIIDTRPADDVRTLPIGTPLTGTEVDVVSDDGGRRCAPGEPGELFIAGVGLTPGYLHAPELTAAAFVERDGRRWYRSGDRVRRGEDGVLEFLGRLDDQVKIRGHRVELGEIESALLTHPAVARAAVVHREERLSAFVQCLPGVEAPDSTAVRAHLARTLPEYMLPARIHLVEELPLTGTGKIDRSVLKPPGAEPQLPGRGSSGSLPSTSTEVLLSRVWSEFLDADADAIRREDDFFALGGDSLLILQVFARLRETIPALPRPTVVYSHRTLAALAAAIDRGPTDEPSPAASQQPSPSQPTASAQPPSPSPSQPAASGQPAASAPSLSPSPFPLSPSQRGFLLAEAMAPGSPTAWLACLRVDGPLRPDAFQQAVDACVVRHPMLRTVFPAGVRPPVQQELPPTLRLPVDFETLDAPELLTARLAEERQRRFESWAWPLLRLRMLTLGPDEHALVVHAHHLIGDGYSVALLGRELLAVYDRVVRGESAELPPLRGAFRDHVELRDHRSASVGGGSCRASGRADEPYRRPVLGRPAGDRISVREPEAPAYRSTGFTLAADQVAALRRIAADAGTTLFAPVLTAYYRTLAATTGQEDLILGLAVSGRDDAHPDAHLVFGPYAAAVPLRPGRRSSGEPATRRTFADDLRAVVQEVEAARSEDVQPARGDGGLPPTAQFFFTYLDFSALGPMAGETLSVRWDDADAELAPPPVGTDTFLAVRPVGDGELRVTLRAATSAFPQETAFAAFTGALRNALTESALGTAGREPRRSVGASSVGASSVGTSSPGALDSALIGYLPAPELLAAPTAVGGHSRPGRTGTPTAADAAASREQLRELLFPGGRPRLLEEIDTPLGRSGFVCLPLFADELASTPDLAARTARAVELAASSGARSVSLAGMIPSLTAYGFGVLRETEAPTALTTGHAATAVSVVKTVHAALDRTGRARVGHRGLGDLPGLADLSVAVVGLGSIGSSSLELLLTLASEPPARLLLCDVPGSAERLRTLADGLIARGLARNVEVHESGRSALPAAVYEADLLVTAVSGGGALLDVSRLRPGTIVVDDSFPHCFDTTKALARMRDRRDVLIVGGGLLTVGAAGSGGSTGVGGTVDVGESGGVGESVGLGGSAGISGSVERRTAPGLPPVVAAGYAARSWLPDTIASCRLESLLHAADPELPLVHGLVDARLALAYWRGVEAAGVTAGPLHLLGHAVAAQDDDLDGFPGVSPAGPARPTSEVAQVP